MSTTRGLEDRHGKTDRKRWSTGPRYFRIGIDRPGDAGIKQVTCKYFFRLLFEGRFTFHGLLFTGEVGPGYPAIAFYRCGRNERRERALDIIQHFVILEQQE